jgi:nucleoside-diphosphate-sugar epimerase
MKILITGAAGFLGLHLAKFFDQKGYQLILVDIADFEKDEYPERSRFVKGDIRDKKLMDSLVKGTDIVIHAAAALPLWKKEDIFAINVEGTRNLLQAALKHRIKRFIFISSTAVYGIPEKHPIEEGDPKVGIGPYGESKIIAELVCEEYRKKGLTVTIIRPKTFIGTHRLGVFEILFDWIKDGKRIPVIGSGNNRYQLLDVDDLVEAIYLLATMKDEDKANDNFNIGAERFGSVKDFLGELFNYAHSGSRLMTTPAAPIKTALFIFEKLKLSPLYQWVYDTADKDSFVSIKKLTSVLRWHPGYSNADALIKAYQWYLENYEEIKSRPAGVTHTAGWKQGILGIIKKIM